MTPDSTIFTALLALAAIGCAVCGVAALLFAVVGFLAGDPTAAGICSLAAALAFGLLLVGLARR